MRLVADVRDGNEHNKWGKVKAVTKMVKIVAAPGAVVMGKVIWTAKDTEYR